MDVTTTEIEVPAAPWGVIVGAVEEIVDGKPHAIGPIDMNRIARAFDELFGTALAGQRIGTEVDDPDACRAALTEIAHRIREDPGEDKEAASAAVDVLFMARAQIRRPRPPGQPVPDAEQRLEVIAMLVDLWRDGAADRLDGENGLLQRVIRVTQVQPAELAGEREAIVALLGGDEDDNADAAIP